MNSRIRPIHPLGAVFSALFLTVLLAGTAFAGANETPGKNYRPHAFGYYSTNQWEFGAVDVGIFQFYVVGHQHYRQGAAYVDAANDYSSGGAGVWNFFTFCTSRAHDVMLVTAHGVRTPATVIEQYPRTARGRAVRDSVLAYYNGIFAAGSLVAGNYAACLTINATQTFYTTYFQTPKAFCWWATCWSSLLSMTGAAEARDFLGYNNVVMSAKCYCDERTILKRMDGQETQAKRPLTAAFAGINADCPPGGASLVRQGAGNTVLSPSVIVNEPTGIVCSPTPGKVKFDCTMDVTVAPAAVVKAFGDGYLDSHSWAGDDEVDYMVIPTSPAPTILYDVIESQARSKADRARLDGNTNPAVNARGPNRDDFIWVTNCPNGWWIYCPDLVTIPDPAPDLTVVTYTPVTNNTGGSMDLAAHLTVTGLQLPMEMQNFTLPAYETVILAWPTPIPPGAVEGQVFPATLTVTGGGDPFTLNSQIVVGGRLRAELIRPVVLGAGLSNPVRVSLENVTDAPLEVGQVEVLDSQGWVVPQTPQDVHLEPGQAAELEFQVAPPPSAPPGAGTSLTLRAMLGPDLLEIPLGTASVGLPVTVSSLDPIDVVPGNADARIPIEIVSLSLTSMNLIYLATDSHGFPVTVEAPPVLQPGETAEGALILPIPNDPSLVGTGGIIDLIIRDNSGYALEQQIEYLIEPSIEVTSVGQSLYTGSSSPRVFIWPMTLRNRSDVVLNGFCGVNAGGYSVLPAVMNFALGPNETIDLEPQIELPPDAPAGLVAGGIQIVTELHTGDRFLQVEHEVTTPVVVDAVDRAWSGEAGELLTIPFALHNRRTDHDMSGSYEISDDQGWVSPLVGNYSLGAEERDTVWVDVQLPSQPAGGQVDSSTVSITVRMTFDTGSPGETRAMVQVMVIPGITQVPDPAEIPGTASLEVSPNPSGGPAQIRFRLPGSQRVRVSVHDAQGRTVATLADGLLSAGSQSLRWDGRTRAGSRAPDGIYFLRLETPSGSWVRKVVRMSR